MGRAEVGSAGRWFHPVLHVLARRVAVQHRARHHHDCDARRNTSSYNNTCWQSTGLGSGSCTAGSSSLGLVSLTGTPADGTVAWNESDPAMKPTAVPPPAQQLNGGALDTGDDRLETAVWQNGTLWATANDACVPGGATHSCLRVVEVDDRDRDGAPRRRPRGGRATTSTTPRSRSTGPGTRSWSRPSRRRHSIPA